jgi:hypothetical protein
VGLVARELGEDRRTRRDRQRTAMGAANDEDVSPRAEHPAPCVFLDGCGFDARPGNPLADEQPGDPKAVRVDAAPERQRPEAEHEQRATEEAVPEQSRHDSERQRDEQHEGESLSRELAERSFAKPDGVGRPSTRA